MRRILIVLAAFIAILILGALTAPSLIDVNKHRPRIEAQLQSKLARPVSIGALTLHLFPLSVRMDNITIGESPAFPSTKPFAAAQDVSAKIELFSLLRGEPVIDSLSFNRPQIELIRNAKGIWNFSTLGGSSSSGSQSELTLKELKLQDGQVALTDDVTNQPRTVYDHVDLRLSGYAPHQRFPVELGLHLPGQGDQLLVLNANVGPVQPGDAASTPIDGQLSLKKVSLSGLTRFLKGGIPPNTEALASGEAQIKSSNELLSCKGSLKLENITIQGAQLNYPIQADYDLTDDRKRDVLQIKSGNIKLGSTPVAISGTVDAGRTPSNLNLHVNMQNESIQEIMHLAGAFHIAFSPSYQIRGKVSADLTAQGPSADPQLSGSASASQVEISGGEIKQPVRIPQLSLTLSPDSIRAAPFTAQAGSTSLNAAFTMSRYTTRDRMIDATLKTDNANVAEVIDMAKAYGVEDAKGLTGTGKISLDVHVQGPAAEPSRLVYSGSGSIAGATLASPALAQKVAVSTANLRFAQNSASIDNLAATVASTNIHGSLSVSDFSAPKLQFNLAADRINTTELQQIGKSEPHAGKSEPHAAGPGLLDKITGSGALAVGNVVANEIVLNNVRATCTLNRGVIELSPLTADIFGGKETGTIILDARPATPLCTLKMKLSGLDANKVLSATSSVKDTLYGNLNADTNLNFALANSTELARTMNGTLGFNVTDGVLKNVNILKEVSKIGQFMGGPHIPNEAATALKRLSGTLDIKNGVANTNDLVAVLAEGSLSGKGVVNLADQGINMHVSAVLNSGVSNEVGGAKVGGFLNTALANNKGELVVPVLVTGSLAKPVITPDAAAIAEMKVKNLLPTTGDPTKLSTGVLNSVLGNKSGGASQTINGVLQGLTGKQPGQQQTQDPIQSLFGSKKKKTTQ